MSPTASSTATSSIWRTRHHGNTDWPNVTARPCGPITKRWATTDLIYTNTVSALPTVMDSLLQALGRDVEAVAVLLTCTEATARKRLSQREKGSELDRHIESSAQMAATLETECSTTVHRVPTDARTIRSVAADVIRLTGWISS
jgi:hypothetical protein